MSTLNLCKLTVLLPMLTALTFTSVALWMLAAPVLLSLLLLLLPIIIARFVCSNLLGGPPVS